MRKYPIIYVVIFYIIGILLQQIFGFKLFNSFIIILLILITTFSLKFIFKLNRLNDFQIILITLTLSFGLVYSSFQNSNQSKYPYQIPKIRNTEIVGEIQNIDLIKNDKISLVLKLKSVNEGNNENFICNIYKDSTNFIDSIYEKIKIGNTINFIGTINRAKDQRNYGEFNYEDYLLKKQFVGIINCYKLESFKILDENTTFLKEIIFAIRKNINDKILQSHNEETSALLKGILLADRSDIDYDIKTSFINSGVIHVLAVSGLHVGFISLILFLALGRFDIRIRYVGTIIGILFFLIITGAHPSVFRASIMAIVYIFAKLTNRDTNGFNSIAIAAFIILIINPNELFNPGFLLSFSAVLSILIFYPIFSRKIYSLNINRAVKKIFLFVSVSLAAQIGTLPFTLFYFSKLSLISLFTNLLVIPMIGIIVAIGILTLIMAIFSNALASIFAFANILLTDLLYNFVIRTSNINYSFLPINNFSIIDGILFYLFLSIAFGVIKFYKKRIILIISLALIYFSFEAFISFDNKSILQNNKLNIYTIDVGQGDSFLIKFPNNKIALIDAGNATEYFDVGERIILPLLNKLEINKIDFAFISHLDSDHFGGVISLVNHGKVTNLYKPRSDENDIKNKILEEFLEANKVEYFLYSNEELNIDGCKLYILNDLDSEEYNNFDSNNKSGVIKLVYGNTSFLFVGDAEFESENLLIKKYREFLKSDVLKVGHHGSNSSTSDEFLKYVNPQIGIISAGIMNKFNHPSDKVINKLIEKNITIYRTDFEGGILLISDGNSISKSDWKNN